MDTLMQWLSYHLPRKFIYFAAIRLIANATTGRYSSQIVPELTAMDAIKRWEKSNEQTTNF